MSAAIVQAQEQDNICPEIVEETLQSVADICTNLDRNTACYGSTDVESTIIDGSTPDFFATPGDNAELLLFSEIRPQPIDEILGRIGVAVLNVQADVPDTLPGQSVIFMIMGDAQLTNESESAFQSFYFLPGITGSDDCYEAEPILTIQTPGNITVDIVLNGVATEMSPGTLLTITPTVCTIHRGNIIQRVDNEVVGSLLANQTIDIRIDENGQVIGTNPNNPRNISEREYERGLLVQTALNDLAQSNGWQEQYITDPKKFDEEPLLDTSSPSPCDTQHTVSSGETLHRIAEQYDTSVLDIAEANNLDNPRVVFVGQTLCIPNPGSGFEPLPAGN
ncbi:MAG: LysM peptidoglycan-binding domain-containing protein [Anaerolineae bacterium]|nr:LysM peptidoglycan-binding domain-containing protein [Anaerolineae bacterium]